MAADRNPRVPEQGMDAARIAPDEAHAARVPLSGMIGDSLGYRRFLEQVRRIARADAPVLIEGETGSGKELAARAVHYLSRRRERRFVAVNCGAIPDTLIESELFGHARGAFTDAKQAQAGVIAHAEGGTLFLDEIDALSAHGQVAMLRFLQDQRYRPLGRTSERSSDARIIAASNRPLQAVVEQGAFRSDLLYRLDILNLQVPPLRERNDDIAALARHFLSLFCARYGLQAKRLHPATVEWMSRHAWPGNVRELENLVHRLVLLSDGDDIHYTGEAAVADPSPETCPANFQCAKARAIEAFERAYLSWVMTETRGNVTAAARLASKERRALGKLLKKHGIDKDRYRDR